MRGRLAMRLDILEGHAVLMQKWVEFFISIFEIDQWFEGGDFVLDQTGFVRPFIAKTIRLFRTHHLYFSWKFLRS